MIRPRFLIIFFIAGLVSLSALSKQSPPDFDLGSDWQKSRDDWGIGDGTWNLKTNRKIYATKIAQDLVYSKDEIEVSKIKDVLLEMTRGRNASLGLIGINDWHITRNSLRKEKSLTLLTIEGGFHDSHSNEVEFKEVHIWKKQKYESLALNYPADSKFGTSEKSELILKRFISSVSESGK